MCFLLVIYRNYSIGNEERLRFLCLIPTKRLYFVNIIHIASFERYNKMHKYKEKNPEKRIFLKLYY